MASAQSTGNEHLQSLTRQRKICDPPTLLWGRQALRLSIVLEPGLLTTGNLFAFLLKTEPDYTPVGLPFPIPKARVSKNRKCRHRLKLMQPGLQAKGQGQSGKKPQP